MADTLQMTIGVWTPEDRETREQLIGWLQRNHITGIEEVINERRRRYTFIKTPQTVDSQWRLLEAKLIFEDELRNGKTS